MLSIYDLPLKSIILFLYTIIVTIFFKNVHTYVYDCSNITKMLTTDVVNYNIKTERNNFFNYLSSYSQYF